jgi:hypothetical protein
MTSKQAKRLYKQITTPKITRAEQRRIEAQERERIKREHERERTAERAKAAREKRQKKANEAKEVRRRMGLPEPSRWVRASQRTIVGFIKRAREQSNDESKGNIDENAEDADQRLDGQSAAKRVALVRLEAEEGFGSLPHFSHLNFPKHLDAENLARDYSNGSGNNGKTSESIRSSPREPTVSQKSSNNANQKHGRCVFSWAEALETASGMELDTVGAKSPSPAQPLQACSVPQRLTQPELVNGTSPRPAESGKKSTGNLPNFTPVRNIDRPSETSDTGPRIPLGEMRNMLPPPIPVVSKRPLSKKITRPNIGLCQSPITPPSSALAFLPSPSQQVRELLEDIDDIPSNTQVAREIGADDGYSVPRLENLQSQPANSVQLAKPLKSARAVPSETTFKSAALPQQSKPGTSRVQIEYDDLGLELLSSQDLVISSQDLRDINTPGRVVTRQLTQRSSQGCVSIKKAARPPPKKKPRFFEEKDDDLLFAAIHESLRAIKQTAHKPSRRNPPPRSQNRAPSAASEYGDEDFEMDIDPELLAVLESAEMKRR